jgi:ankyrin repeat protein
MRGSLIWFQPEPPLYYIDGNLYTNGNWEHLRSSIFDLPRPLDTDGLTQLGIPKQRTLGKPIHVVQLVRIQLCQNESCYQPLPYSSTPAFCIHCQKRTCKRKRNSELDEDEDEDEDSPPSKLRDACAEGDLPLTRRLLKKCKPDEYEIGLTGCLEAAIKNENAEIVDALIKAGADVNQEISDWHYDSALQMACDERLPRIIRILLDAGADAKADVWAFQNACHNGDTETLELLLERGAIPSSSNDLNPLSCACSSGDLATVKLLLDRGADIDVNDDLHGGPLVAACSEGHASVVAELLDRGAKLDALIEYWLEEGSRPDTDAIKLLSENGRGVHAATKDGEKLLTAAAWFKSLESVKLLLEKGAAVDSCGPVGTALTAACIRGSQDIVKLLLDWKADVTIEGGDYGTALQAACCEGHYELIPLLLEHGADPYSEGGEGGSAIQIIQERNRLDLVDQLKRLSRHPDPTLIAQPSNPDSLYFPQSSLRQDNTFHFATLLGSQASGPFVDVPQGFFV